MADVTGVSSQYDQLLDEQPSLRELCNHAKSAEWYKLGIQLELDIVDLDIIKKDPSELDKLTSMYKLWQNKQGRTATRKKLFNALESDYVGQKNTAEKYEKWLKEEVAKKEKRMQSKRPSIKHIDIDVKKKHSEINDPELTSLSPLTMPSLETRIWTNGEAGPDIVEACLQRLKASGIFPEDNEFMRRVAYVMSRDGNPLFRLYTDGGIWQVSVYAFKDTMDNNSHGRLTMKYEKIFMHFGIKWKEVDRGVLAKPIYSALAARLYLSNFAEFIPPSYQHDYQANYWWDKYMFNHESKRHMVRENFLTGINELENDFEPAASREHLQPPLHQMSAGNETAIPQTVSGAANQCESKQNNIVPRKDEVLDLLADISAAWHEIGLALHVSDNALRGFHANTSGNVVKLSNVIENWITTESSPVTWETLILAIEGQVLKNRKKGNEIREYLARRKL